MSSTLSFLRTPGGILGFVTASVIKYLEVEVSSPRFALSVLALISPHILYYYIWNSAGQFQHMFGKKSVDVFAFAATCLKALQLFTWVQWYTGIPDFEYLIIAIVLFAIGSVLNGIVYRKLGNEGVYYGFKLGHTIPWVSSFPFNCMRHPQYIGSVLSWTSIALMCSSMYSREVTALLLVQVTAYFYTAHMESQTDFDSKESRA